MIESRLREAFERLGPSEEAKRRMLTNILATADTPVGETVANSPAADAQAGACKAKQGQGRPVSPALTQAGPPTSRCPRSGTVSPALTQAGDAPASVNDIEKSAPAPGLPPTTAFAPRPSRRSPRDLLLRVALPLAACLAIAVMLNTTVVPQLFSGITGGETPLAASDQSSSARSLASEAALPSAQDVQQVVPDSQENLAATDAQDAAGTAEASAAANADAPTLSQSTASAYDATTAAPTEGDTLLWALLTALVTLPVLLLAAALIFLLFRR